MFYEIDMRRPLVVHWSNLGRSLQVTYGVVSNAHNNGLSKWAWTSNWRIVQSNLRMYCMRVSDKRPRHYPTTQWPSGLAHDGHEKVIGEPYHLPTWYTMRIPLMIERSRGNIMEGRANPECAQDLQGPKVGG